MVIHELAPDDCRTVMARVHVARLGCARADQPYIVPILCYYDPEGDCLYSVAAVGQKIEWMRQNPKVCVEFSEIADQFHWTTVVAFGRYEELTESFADSNLRHRARGLFEQHYEWWYPAMQKPDPTARAKSVVYRIRIDRLTGRRASRGQD